MLFVSRFTECKVLEVESKSREEKSPDSFLTAALQNAGVEGIEDLVIMRHIDIDRLMCQPSTTPTSDPRWLRHEPRAYLRLLNQMNHHRSVLMRWLWITECNSLCNTDALTRQDTVV
jgi:hypothetical protein